MTEQDDLLETDPGVWAKEQSIVMPKFKDPFPLDRDYVASPIMSSDGQIADITDYNKLNSQIDSVRIALYKTTEYIRQAEMKCSQAQLEYQRRFNRSYLSSDAKTEQQRKTVATIQNEHYENMVATRQWVLDDLKNRSRMLAQQLEALKTIAYNFRKESDILQ